MIVNFVNRIHEARYEIKDNYAPSYDYFPDMTIRSDSYKIVGVTIEKSKGRFLRDDTLCTRDLDQPPLSVGARIHDKAFRVREFIRNADNTYNCVVDYVIEDTTESLTRKHELESEIIAQENKVADLKSVIEQLRVDLKHEKSKTIWQRLKDKLFN